MLQGISHVLLGQADFTVSGPGGAERVDLEQVDFYTLQVLGVRPLPGRWCYAKASRRPCRSRHRTRRRVRRDALDSEPAVWRARMDFSE